MLRSVLLKEWLKLKHYFIAALAVNAAVCCKIFLDIRQQMHTEHAEMVWYQAIHLHAVPYQDIQFLPLATGLLFATAQYVPEMLGRRMRISLHLPIDRNKMLLAGQLAGLLLLMTMIAVDSLSVFLMMKSYYPVEVAMVSLPTIAPWALSGLVAYCGTATVLLETYRLRRVFLALVFSTLAAMLLSGHGYSWITPALSWFIWLVPLCILSFFESGRRFQQRGA